MKIDVFYLVLTVSVCLNIFLGWKLNKCLKAIREINKIFLSSVMPVRIDVEKPPISH